MLGCFKRASHIDEDDEGRKQVAAVNEKGKPPVSDSSERLQSLRQSIEDAKLDYYVVPSTDPHQSEFTSAHDKRLAFLSGFTGEGVAIVDKEKARLFVNGIYWSEAEEMTDSKHWTVMKEGSKDVPSWADFLGGLKDCRIGMDDRLINLATYRNLRNQTDGHGIEFVFPSDNLVERMWTDQPQLTASNIFIHDKHFTGKDASEKLADLRRDVEKLNGAAYLTHDLPEIAWLLNLRASDQPTTPVFYSFLCVRSFETLLFVRESQLDNTVKRYLEESLKVTVKPYNEVSKTFAQLEWEDGICLVASNTPYFLVRSIGETHVRIVESPVAERRAVKNKVELQNMREAYLQDATAWVRWLAWLEEAAGNGKRLTEFECGQKLVHYASQQPHYFCPSYDPLFQCGPNGAKPHYAPTKDKTDVVDFKKMIVADIGFNWLNGTCDTTRTLHMHPKYASEKERRAFTRVLQGHIAVDTAHFPKSQGTGSSLDALARQYLWRDGLNYTHGTGHGLGSFLNVHETPPMIAARSSKTFQIGNVMSNEPGMYQAGHFGTRTESVIAVIQAKTRYDWGDDAWYGFERFTRVPIQKSLVDRSIFTPTEFKWLHEHNELCKKDIAPRLMHDKRALKWLLRQ